MADRQTEADKIAAMREYRAEHDAAVNRMAALKAARIARDAQNAQRPEAKSADVKPAGKKAPAKKPTAKTPAVRLAKPR